MFPSKVIEIIYQIAEMKRENVVTFEIQSFVKIDIFTFQHECKRRDVRVHILQLHQMKRLQLERVDCLRQQFQDL